MPRSITETGDSRVGTTGIVEAKRSEWLTDRRGLARTRMAEARRMLSRCSLCAHNCGVNRLAGERGLCGAGEETRCFSAQIEAGDELAISPTFAVAFSGCDLRCDFCISGASSWNARAGIAASAHDVGAMAVRALSRGAASVMILGGEPAIHLPFALEVVAELPEEARLVWKTNAHNSPGARALLDGMFDVWLADLKFGNDDCAGRIAGVPNYLGVVQDNLVWAFRHADLIVRHLLLPGHLECCWSRIAQWLALELPDVKVSLRTEFWPGWFARRHSELRSAVSPQEVARALEIGRQLGLNLVQ